MKWQKSFLINVFCKYKKKYKEIESDFENLREEHKSLQGENKNLQGNFTNCTDRLATISEQLKILEKEHKNLQKDFADCTERLATVSKQFENLQEEHGNLQREHGNLQGEHDLLSVKQALIRDALNAPPISDENFVEYCRIYEEEFLSFANEESALAEEAQAIEDLRKVGQELRLISQFASIKRRRIVAIGGGFSAGKSEFLNRFVLDPKIKLPIGINPVTAFPTYVIPEDSHTIKGFTPTGGTFDIKHIFGKLDHQFIDSLKFNLRKIMSMVTIETQLAFPAGENKGQNIEHICFIDTPGYNAPSSHGAKDRDVSLPYLEEADGLLWLIALDRGTIPNEDLDLLEDLELEEKGKKLYIVANKADLKAPGDRELVVDEIADKLEDRGIAFEGISAFSSIDVEQEQLHRKIPLFDFLAEQDTVMNTSNKIFKQIMDVLYRYRDALQKDMDEAQGILTALKELELNIMEEGVEIDTSSVGVIRKGCGYNKKLLSQHLKELKEIGEKMLQAAAVIVGAEEIPALEIDALYKPQRNTKPPPKASQKQKEIYPWTKTYRRTSKKKKLP